MDVKKPLSRADKILGLLSISVSENLHNENSVIDDIPGEVMELEKNENGHNIEIIEQVQAEEIVNLNDPYDQFVEQFEGDDSDKDSDYILPTSCEDESEEESTYKAKKRCILSPKPSTSKAMSCSQSGTINNIFTSEDNNVSLVDNNATVIIGQKKRKRNLTRKIVPNVKEWKCNIRKTNIAGGLPYISKNGKSMPGKQMKPPCSCKLKCFNKISNEIRKEIYNFYWDPEKNNDVKRQFIASKVKANAVERKRPKDGSKKRDISLKYHFTINNEDITICKQMFLSTLSISQTVVTNALKKQQTGGMISLDKRGRKTPPNKTPVTMINRIKEHISSFPLYESHYSREKTQRKFLGPHLSIKKMFELFLDKSKNENEEVCKEWLYRHIFCTEYNLSFKQPSTDTCDVCDRFTVSIKNAASQEESALIKAEYDKHLDEASNRYQLKKMDKLKAKSDSSIKVLTGDLQKCLPTPYLTNTQSFYLRKLWTLNFTLLNSVNGESHCFLWDESKAARGGNEISSSILKWAHLNINEGVRELTIWTDNCPGQNRNINVIMAHLFILNKFKSLNTINHKYLLVGHTHQEVDGVHAQIEKTKKFTPTTTILTPAGWQQLISSISDKVKVVNMELQDFYDFKELCSKLDSYFVSKKVNMEGEPFLISDAVHLQVRRDSPDMIYYKTSFEDHDFKKVYMRRKTRRSSKDIPENLNIINKKPLPISVKKYKDLQTALKFLPSECHNFYNSLSQSHAVVDAIDDPVTDD